jgi:hypothetical protein
MDFPGTSFWQAAKWSLSPWYRPTFPVFTRQVSIPNCRHAFAALGCVRVALRADFRNLRSRNAIERLGAMQEGSCAST